jgi:hypothetical protein
VEPDYTWYDELLVWEHTVIVIGFSYSRGGTEIGLFDLGANGDLRHRATYHLRSYDYYSGSNYASRLIGGQLVLFTTFGLPDNTDPDAWLPAIRRRHDGETSGFESITSINRVFRPVAPLDVNSPAHTMVICNMAAPSLTCEATVVLGDALMVFYASPTAGYLDGEKKASRRIVVSAWEGESASSLRLTHDAQRIEAIGAHAVVVGTAGDSLSMTAIRLGHQPRVAGALTQQNVFQSEDRSHAFFYREDGPDVGVFGLPIVTMSENENHDPREQSARILFVRNRALTFIREGTLDKSSEIPIDDDCRVSCLDWYGNVRPIFIDDRTFALLGYEIVEGRLVRGRVEEVRRLDFTPRTARIH